MKPVLTLLLLTLVWGSPVAAQPDGALPEAIQAFDDGTALVRSGQFREALVAFEAAAATGYASDALWYNMGVAHYRLDHLGEAIRHFERALRLAPDDERILHSLSVAERRRADTFSVLPVPFWKRGHARLLSWMSAWGWFWTGLGLLYTASLVAIVRLLMGWSPSWSRRLGRWALAAALPILLFALASAVRPPIQPAAVVLRPAVSMTEQPDPGAADVEEIHEGTRVSILTEADGWLLVRLSNGVEGWLPTSSVGRI